MIVILLDKLPPSRKIGQNKSAKNQHKPATETDVPNVDASFPAMLCRS
jgi:hypothetical protein